jgi:hypothetical protein
MLLRFTLLKGPILTVGKNMILLIKVGRAAVYEAINNNAARDITARDSTVMIFIFFIFLAPPSGYGTGR